MLKFLVLILCFSHVLFSGAHFQTLPPETVLEKTLLKKSYPKFLALNERDELAALIESSLKSSKQLGPQACKEEVSDLASSSNPVYKSVVERMRRNGCPDEVIARAIKKGASIIKDDGLKKANAFCFGEVFYYTSTVDDIDKLITHFMMFREISINAARSFNKSNARKGDSASAQNERIIIQGQIDHFAFANETIKEGYQILLLHRPQEAHRFLEKIGPNTVLAKFLIGETKEPPSFEACIREEAQKRAQTATRQIQGNDARSRLQRKQQSKQKNRADSNRELIRKAIAFEAERQKIKDKLREEKAALNKAKAARAAERLKEAMKSANANQLCHMTANQDCQIAPKKWVGNEEKIKVKTRGIADENLAASSYQRTSLPDSDDTLEQEQNGINVSNSTYKMLEDFWGRKNHIGYDEVSKLFKNLGGDIRKKKGGSSHETLVYYLPNGSSKKFGIYRPHGNYNAFGYKTIIRMKQFFKDCGLVIPEQDK